MIADLATFTSSAIYSRIKILCFMCIQHIESIVKKKKTGNSFCCIVNFEYNFSFPRSLTAVMGVYNFNLMFTFCRYTKKRFWPKETGGSTYYNSKDFSLCYIYIITSLSVREKISKYKIHSVDFGMRVYFSI